MENMLDDKEQMWKLFKILKIQLCALFYRFSIDSSVPCTLILLIIVCRTVLRLISTHNECTMVRQYHYRIHLISMQKVYA